MKSKGSKYFVDRRLVALVEEFITKVEGKTAPPTLDSITEYILTYREYQRKNQQSLKRTISKVLKQLDSQNKWSADQLQLDDSEDEDLSGINLVEEKDYNTFNSQLLNSYKQQNATAEATAPDTPNGSEKKKKKKKADGDEDGARKKRLKSASKDVDDIITQKLTDHPGNFDIIPAELPNFGFEKLGGIEHIIAEVRENVEWPMLFPQVYNELGTKPPRGILLHGPPGCGKTLLANAIVGDLGKKIPDLVFFRVSGPELVSGMSGESEKNIRALFNTAKTVEPCLIFIDEIDAISPKRESASKEMERRIVATLLTSFDGANCSLPHLLTAIDLAEFGQVHRRVIVIGATNRLDSLDPSLRRSGRFDREIGLGVPDEKTRASILKVHSANLKLSGDFDFLSIARKTPGYVGADLTALASEAGSIAIKRILSRVDIPMITDPAEPMEQDDAQKHSLLTQDQIKDLHITMQDFEQATKKVQPSAKREGFATIPNVSWSDVGALQDVRKELSNYVIQPIKCPERFAQLGLDAPAGILLYGPPGCGKTLLAKAIANDCVKGPELLNKYVGESEKAVRKVFERQATELDAIVPRRDDDGNAATKRVVNQILTELDGVEERKGIFVIGATNRPDIIDPAMLRPGRFDKLLYVPLPDVQSRVQILQTLARKSQVDPQVNLRAVAEKCVRFSGADLAALIREAAVLALSKHLDNNDLSLRITVKQVDFEDAFRKVFPSVSEEEERKYLMLQNTIRKANLV